MTETYEHVLKVLGCSPAEIIDYELNGFVANLNINTLESTHLMDMKKRLFKARLISLFDYVMKKKG